ncbi:MAG: CARDB domain-containing protein [Balneolaceae bacterium]
MNKLLIFTLTLLTLTSCKLFNSDSDSDPDPEDPSAGVTDIAINEVEAPGFISEESTADISVSIVNVGSNAVSDSISITLTNEDTEEVISTQKINGLAVNDTTILTFSWNTEGVPEGEYTISASHDLSDDEVSNNTKSATVTISAKSENDIAISTFNAPASITQGEDAEIEVILSNSGEEDISEDITITLSDETDITTIDTQTVNGLTVGEETTLTFTWNSGGASIGDHTVTAMHDFEDDNDSNNSQSTTVTVNEELVADIAVSNIIAPESVTMGEDAGIEVTISNSGEDDISEEIAITLSDDTDNTTIDTQTINGLSAGDETTLTFTWNSGGASIGDHTITAMHNFEDDDNSNNSQSTTVTVNEELVADIAVSNITAPESVTIGENANIEVTISNPGEDDISEEIVITLFDETDNTTINTQTISGLSVGSETTLNFTWNTSGSSNGDHTIVATHDFEDDDSSNDSQSTTITINEDVNSDIAITVTDAPENVTRGETAVIDVLIENLGDFDITDAIRVFLTHHQVEEADSQYLDNGLSAGSSATLTLHWDTSSQTTGPPPHPIVLQHDFDDGIPANNADTTYIQVDLP